jgi:hypothetical protein
MRRAWQTAAAALSVAAIAVAACGGGGGNAGYPSRDWSGSYLTRMVGSSSDCRDASVPPPIPQFIAELRQDPANRAILWMSPVVQLTGTFHGDVLEVRASFAEALTLPDSLVRRIEAADSFDTVTYHLRAELDEEWRFRAEYEIRTPDVRALVAGARPLRCTLRYELEGARFEPPALSDQPWLDSLRGTGAPPAGAPAGEPGATGEPAAPR